MQSSWRRWSTYAGPRFRGSFPRRSMTWGILFHLPRRRCWDFGRQLWIALYGAESQSDRIYSSDSAYDHQSKSSPASPLAEAKATVPWKGQGTTSPDRDGEDVQIHDSPLPDVEEGGYGDASRFPKL